MNNRGIIEVRYSFKSSLRMQAMDLLLDDIFSDEYLNIENRIRELIREFPELCSNLTNLTLSEVVEMLFIEPQPDERKSSRVIESEKYLDRLFDGFPECLNPREGAPRWIIQKFLDKIRYECTNRQSNTLIGVLEHPFDTLRVNIDIPVYPSMRTRELKDRAIQAVQTEIECKWKEIYGNVKYLKRLRGPDELERDIRWLYRCVFYGYKGGKQQRSFSDARFNSPQYINNRIRQTAKLLDIKLPGAKKAIT
jgi:hypothetical protein